ncbi:MAG: class I SAM-dependent methyltransferase [Chloroflexi bacterium]|nr:class I SAM-dependent methyltransferase [Chloroflexota bacterium]
MPQNIYDDPEFFAGYDRMRTHGISLPETLEQPAIRSLLTNVQNKRVLDMGCGAGVMSNWLVEQGAENVLGVDVSIRMLEKARENPHPRIEYRQIAAEDLEFPDGSFDLVVSSLMFHYVEGLKSLLGKARRWLTGGGMLVFSTEHPIFTAAQGLYPDPWIKDEDGNNLAWKVDSYASEGQRVSRWFVDGVVRYHRTLATLINWLIEVGFRVTRLLEPHAVVEAERQHPVLLGERKRPAFLFVAAEAAL